MPYTLPQGFQIGNTDPIDKRIVVSSSADRLGFSINNVFEGLTVYETGSGNYYILTDKTNWNNENGWTPIALGSGSSGVGFPFSGSAVITGSLLVSGSSPTVVVSGSLFVTDGVEAEDLTLTGTGIPTITSATDIRLNAPNNIVISSSATIITGSLDVNGGITGSLYGTSSQAISASYVLSSSQAVSASYSLSSSQATTASYALNSTSASYALNSTSASYSLSSSQAASASYVLSSSQAVSASYATNAQNILPTTFEIDNLPNATGSGIIVSASSLSSNHYNSIRIGDSELIDSYNNYFLFNIAGNGGWAFSSSIFGPIAVLSNNGFQFYEEGAKYNFQSSPTNFKIYQSASATNITVFNVDRVTGNTIISGSISAGGININNAISSLTDVTSSYVLNSQTSSFVLNSQTSSFVLNSQTSSFVLNSQTSSFVLNSQTSSFLLSSATGSFGNTTIDGNLIINNDLYVYGTSSVINVQNLLVEDRFILLNSGSVDNINEGGIIIQTTSSEGTASGTAMYYDQQQNRWAVARSSSVVYNATEITFGATTDYVVTVSSSTSGAPTGVPPNFGNGNDSTSVGQMYVDLTNHDIYIYA